MSDTSKPVTQSPEKSRSEHPDPAFEPRKRRKGRGKGARRTFTAAYKLRILEEIDALEATGEGQIGSILRREGLYSSHLTTWRKQREQGSLEALGRKRGRKVDSDKELRRELAKLRTQNEALSSRLAKAEAVIDVQKKLCDLLGLESSGVRS